MKKTILLFFHLLVLGMTALTAQNLELSVRYSIPNARYEVYARPSSTNATFNWGNSQISIVVPASVPNADLVITSVEAGAWDDNSFAFAPGAAPGSDFKGIGSLGAPVNFTAGVEKLIFHFTLPGGGCVDGIRIFNNASDPSSAAAGMNGGDFRNTVVDGTGTERYVTNYNNNGTICTDNAKDCGCLDVTVSLDANCKFELTPTIISSNCTGGTVRVMDNNQANGGIIDCAGVWTYGLFDNAGKLICWGKVTAEDKTAPKIECTTWFDGTLDCWDVNYVLNNALTVGDTSEGITRGAALPFVGAPNAYGPFRSPVPSATGSQTINNAEGVLPYSGYRRPTQNFTKCGAAIGTFPGQTGTPVAGSIPPTVGSDRARDNVKNLGYTYFRDNCFNCGCRTNIKWSDKVVFYSCTSVEFTRDGLYAKIFREWVATDCNGMRKDTVQEIKFARPLLTDFAFRDGDGNVIPDPDGNGGYDRIVTYNTCTPDKSLIKKADVMPSDTSYFNEDNMVMSNGDWRNIRTKYLDEVECNYSVSIKDTEFPVCGGKGIKIDRIIEVFDWCDGRVEAKIYKVLIKIGDFEAPQVVQAKWYPEVSTGPMDCTAAIPTTINGIKTVFGVEIKDNCGVANASVTVKTRDRYVKGIFVAANMWDKVEYQIMNGVMIGLPVGRHRMIIDAYDGCYNSKRDSFDFDVVDKTAPVMKCDDDLHITLTSAGQFSDLKGYARVDAEDIDEGSWDNCKMDWIRVRRNVPASCAASFILKGYDTNNNGKLDAATSTGNVDNADGFDLNGDGDIADFGESFLLKEGKLMTPLQDFVEFFCCDLTERVTIELWGQDASSVIEEGSRDDFKIRTVTKVPGTNPDGVDVPDPSDDNGDKSGIQVVSGGNRNFCWMDVLIEDKVQPTCIAPWALTIDCDDKCLANMDDRAKSSQCWGDVTITSGNDCADVTVSYSIVDKKLKCGYGTFTRRWTVTKQTVKGPVSVSCNQVITVKAHHDYDICFPKDAVTDCKTPVVDTVLTDEYACDILSVNVAEKRYEASDDECYKIFRTYTVINWCTFEDNCGDPMAVNNLLVINRGTFGNFGKSPIYLLARDRDYNVKLSVATISAPIIDSLQNGTRGAGNRLPIGYVQSDRSTNFAGRDATRQKSLAGALNTYQHNASSNTTVEFKRDSEEEFWISADLTAGNTSVLANGDNDNSSSNNNKSDLLVNGSMPYCTNGQTTFPTNTEPTVAPESLVHGFMYTQIIKVYDNTAPVVAGVRDTFCIREGADCLADIKIPVTATDNCTDKVTLETQFLMIAPGQTLKAGDMILYGTPRWSTKDLGNGKFEITVKDIPVGTHDLIVVVRDECGNLSKATRIPFRVEDCKGPAPICINGLSTELMSDGNNGGMMAVWASDFVASKIYDCNGQGPETQGNLKLVTKYSINRVGSPVVSTQTGLNLTCADAGKVVLVELHAWDEAGKDDFCVTYIEVQDNRKVCKTPVSGTVSVAGKIATEGNANLQGATITLSGAASQNAATAANGGYSFINLTKGADFTVTPQLDKNHLNGVSTFDLVLIQKHILNVQALNSPYKMIAADVNNSKSITTLDLIALRKLILNIDQSFANNTSWRFVDAAYSFPTPSNPWAASFPEVANINDIANNVTANFVAIKIGDVNGSASVSGAVATEVRGAKSMTLSTEELEMTSGQTYELPFRAKDLSQLQGFQFTMQFADQVELLDLEYAAMKAENFGVFVKEGVITTSFNTSTALADDALLFTLKLRAKANTNLSEVVSINSRVTNTEAYNQQNEVMGVQLSFNQGLQQFDRVALYQNSPNPFTEETALSFYLPEAAKAVVTIRDVKGALIYKVEGNYAKGMNQILLKEENLRAAGVMYYTFETADFIGTRKMILLQR